MIPSCHVYPINDEREHDTESLGQCWCAPRVEFNDPDTGEAFIEPLVIHRSADGRELIEEVERIFNSPDRHVPPTQ